MADRINLFLPSAGLGERLRPVTLHAPKPLLPVLGRPLIEIILERAGPVCTGGIGINLHHMPELIRRWAEGSPYSERINLFPEDPILGTGGALKNAGEFLSQGPFLVHNTDILTDIDLNRLIEAHLSSGNIATLATHKHPALSNVVTDGEGLVVGVEYPGGAVPGSSAGTGRTAFTGVAVYSPDILGFIPRGASHVTSAWLSAGAAGRRVQAVDFAGCQWVDIGTPETYAGAVLEALMLEGETVYLSPRARCGDVEVDGRVVLESGSEAADGARLRNCMVMPGARVSGEHENSIVGPDYEVGLEESHMQPLSLARKRVSVSLSGLFEEQEGGGTGGDRADALLVGTGGSDRRYYRVRAGGRSAILMRCGPGDGDFERHIAYTRFFVSQKIPVPWLLGEDRVQKSALFEDLGDTSLYSYLKVPRTSGRVLELYRKALEVLAGIHLRATKHAGECPPLAERVFDYSHLRWETAYFMEWYVAGIRGIEPPEALDREFHRLAAAVDAFPKTVVHRDFQSQNIMVTRAEPRVIDFQGARMGPPAYDLASLLWDPYYRLEEDAREGLVDYYISLMKAGGFDESTLRESLLLCRMQRHMQALGAFAFLSSAKGKGYFLKHAVEGLSLLKADASEARDGFPALWGLVKGL